MKLRIILATTAVLALLALLVFLIPTETILISATSDSGRKKAEIIESNKGLFAKTHHLKITTVESGVSFVQDKPQLDSMPEAEIRQVKLKWNSDMSLIIELPNGMAHKIWLDEVGPSPERTQ